MKSPKTATSLNHSLTILIAVLISAGSALAAKPGAQVIYGFLGGGDGSNPVSNLIADAAGNLYGTTEYGGAGGFYGTVFELVRPTTPGGTWTKNALYSFTNHGDGARPTAGVIFDAAGNLYGTTSDSNAGGYGEIFQLAPPTTQGGAWTESVLYSFTGGKDGAGPHGGLVADPAGNLYGTTASSVFELSPPSAPGDAWSFAVLHSFRCCTSDGWNSVAGLVRDQSGNLYGTTEWGGFLNSPSCGSLGCGTVFKVTPPRTPGGIWKQEVLYTFLGSDDGFIPLSGLALDLAGNLYGTAYSGGTLGGGVAFQLTPPTQPNPPWTETVLHNFSYGAADGAAPVASMIFDKIGNLYGTTEFGGNPCIYNSGAYGCGIVFELVRPAGGTGVWTEAELARFTLGHISAKQPGSSLMFDQAGILYGTTIYGGNNTCTGVGDGCGTVFKVIR
jgi:hypothetical protein